MTTKRERFAEMRRTIERVCDADKATIGATEALRERIPIDVLIGAADAMQPKQPGRVQS